MSTSIGAYPVTLPEAWAEIRELRAALLGAASRLQTREAWQAEPMDDVRRHHREREASATPRPAPDQAERAEPEAAP